LFDLLPFSGRVDPLRSRSPPRALVDVPLSLLGAVPPLPPVLVVVVDVFTSLPLSSQTFLSSILPPEADLVNLLLPLPRRADRSSDRAEDAARRAARCLGGSDDGTAREMLIWTDDDDDGLLASGWTEGPRP
jgi:hypothetical protein